MKISSGSSIGGGSRGVLVQSVANGGDGAFVLTDPPRGAGRVFVVAVGYGPRWIPWEGGLRLGVPAARVLGLGDNRATEVAGAVAGGLVSLQLADGVREQEVISTPTPSVKGVLGVLGVLGYFRT